MAAKWLLLSGFGAGLSVIMTAVGFHGLASKIDPHHLALWDTGCRCLMYGAFSLGILGLTMRGAHRQRIYELAAWGIALGCFVFSLGNFGFALIRSNFLFLITPIGAVAWILGLFVFGWAAFKDRAAR